MPRFAESQKVKKANQKNTNKARRVSKPVAYNPSFDLRLQFIQLVFDPTVKKKKGLDKPSGARAVFSLYTKDKSTFLHDIEIKLPVEKISSDDLTRLTYEALVDFVGDIGVVATAEGIRVLAASSKSLGEKK